MARLIRLVMGWVRLSVAGHEGRHIVGSSSRVAVTGFEVCQSLAGGGFEFGQIITDSGPQDFETDAIVGVPQPVPHSPDLSPGLPRHQCFCLVAEPVNGLADPFQTTFDAVSHEAIPFEVSMVHPSNVALDTLGVLDDVDQRVSRVMFRRQVCGPDQCCGADGASRQARGADRPCVRPTPQFAPPAR